MVFFLLFLLLLGLILQLKMAPGALEKLTCSLRAVDYLVEPGDPATVVVTVENRSRLPVLFLQCSCSVPSTAQLLPGSRGELVHYVHSSVYRFDCFLLPRQRLEHTFSLSLEKRGAYSVSNLKLSAGDFLGLQEKTREYPGSCWTVILPRRPEGGIHRQVLGGLMGERSVNRWIHEDPILSAGFREYTGREPQKTISWSRSLQSGRLMVRQMDHTAEEKVTVLFSADGGEWEQLENGFRLCRGVCEMLEERKLSYAFLHNAMLMTQVGLLPPVEAGLGRNHLNRILEGLGRAQPYAVSSLEALIRKTLARGQDSTCFLLLVPKRTQEVLRLAQRLENQSGGTVELLTMEAGQ